MSGLDITEAHSPNISFAEAARAAEEAARAADGETPAEEPVVEAEAPAPVVAEPEPVAEEAEAAAAEEEAAAERLLAGRFKSVEELERGYTEALNKLSQRDEKAAGYDDLRVEFEQRMSELRDQVSQPRVQVTPDLIDTNPAYATQVAYEQKDPATLGVAFENWRQVDEGSANLWLAQAQASEREQALRADYDQKLAALEKRIEPLAAATETDELRRGVEQLPAATKAFLSDAQAVESLANEFPSIGTVIVSGTPAQRLEAVKALHEIHRGRSADNLATSTQEVARQTALEAQAARDDAHVASASTASQEEPKTREQIEQEAAVAAFTRPRGIWADAFVRPGK